MLNAPELRVSFPEGCLLAGHVLLRGRVELPSHANAAILVGSWWLCSADGALTGTPRCHVPRSRAQLAACTTVVAWHSAILLRRRGIRSRSIAVTRRIQWARPVGDWWAVRRTLSLLRHRRTRARKPVRATRASGKRVHGDLAIGFRVANRRHALDIEELLLDELVRDHVAVGLSQKREHLVALTFIEGSNVDTSEQLCRELLEVDSAFGRTGKSDVVASRIIIERVKLRNVLGNRGRILLEFQQAHDFTNGTRHILRINTHDQTVVCFESSVRLESLVRDRCEHLGVRYRVLENIVQKRVDHFLPRST